MIFVGQRMPSVLCLPTETAAEKYSPPAGASQLKEFTISSSIHVLMQVEMCATLICHSLCRHWAMQDPRATGLSLNEGDGVVFVNRNVCYQGTMLNNAILHGNDPVIRALSKCWRHNCCFWTGPQIGGMQERGGVGPTVAPCGGHTDSSIKDRGHQYEDFVTPQSPILPSESLMWCSLLEIICFRSHCENKPSTLLKSCTLRYLWFTWMFSSHFRQEGLACDSTGCKHYC